MSEAPSFGLILDTHVWIWLNTGGPELSSSAVQMIEEASAAGKIFLSAISVWEVAILTAKHRITLSLPIDQWVEEALSGINLLPLSPAIAIESSRLPADFHSDPADRIVVATARVHSGALMTRDDRILSYARDGHVSAVKV